MSKNLKIDSAKISTSLASLDYIKSIPNVPHAKRLRKLRVKVIRLSQKWIGLGQDVIQAFDDCQEANDSVYRNVCLEYLNSLRVKRDKAESEYWSTLDQINEIENDMGDKGPIPDWIPSYQRENAPYSLNMEIERNGAKLPIGVKGIPDFGSPAMPRFLFKKELVNGELAFPENQKGPGRPKRGVQRRVRVVGLSQNSMYHKYWGSQQIKRVKVPEVACEFCQEFVCNC